MHTNVSLINVVNLFTALYFLQFWLQASPLLSICLLEFIHCACIFYTISLFVIGCILYNFFVHDRLCSIQFPYSWQSIPSYIHSTASTFSPIHMVWCVQYVVFFLTFMALRFTNSLCWILRCLLRWSNIFIHHSFSTISHSTVYIYTIHLISYDKIQLCKP